ncbi:MAG: beta strand repeat-containing protein [Chlorobiota bacterium]
MKKLILLIAIALIAVSTGLSLEPTRVSVYAPAFRAAPDGTPATSVRIDLVDYSSGSANTLFTGNTFTAPDAEVTADDNGVITVNVGQDASVAVAWDNIDAGNMNTFWTFDVYINGTLYSQGRIDQQVIIQANTSIFNSSGVLVPSGNPSTVGADNQRFDAVYVKGIEADPELEGVFIGPTGSAGTADLALQYDPTLGAGGEGIISSNGAAIMNFDATGVDLNGTIVDNVAEINAGNQALAISGAFTANQALNTIGDNTDGLQLTIDGVPSTQPVPAGEFELEIDGDAKMEYLEVSGFSLTGDFNMNDNTIYNVEEVVGRSSDGQLLLNATPSASPVWTANGPITTGTGLFTINGNLDADAGVDVFGANLTVNDGSAATPGTDVFVVNNTNGNTDIAGTLTVDGNTTIGDANTDEVFFNAEVSSNFVPFDGNRDLGLNTNHRWRSAYLNDVLHIGPDNGETTNTELAVNYGGNQANFNVDGGNTEFNIDAGNTNIEMDPNANGTFNYRFEEGGLTVSNPGAFGDIVVTDGGILTANAQDFSFLATTGNIDVVVDGNIDVQTNGSLIGDGTDATQLTVEGLVAGATDALVVQGSTDIDARLNVDGNTTLNANVTLGDAAADEINVLGEFVSNLVPQNASAPLSLGTDANRWAEAYILGTSVHVGPNGGEGTTELNIGYAGNAATFNVDNATNMTINAGIDRILFNPAGDGDQDVYIDEGELNINSGNVPLIITDSDINRNNGADQTLAFQNSGGNLNVTIDGNIAVAEQGSTMGNSSDNTQLTINGATGTNNTLQVTGDANIDGQLTVNHSGEDVILATLGAGTTIALTNDAAVHGDAETNNTGVAGQSVSGTGVYGASTSGFGVYGTTGGTVAAVEGRNDNSTGLATVITATSQLGGNATGFYGNSNLGIAANFENTNAANASNTVLIENNGTGTALQVNATGTGDAANFNGNIVVTGTSNLQGNVDADSDLNVDGNTTLNGNVDLGDGVTDLITPVGRFDDTIEPNVTNTYDLGLNTFRWRNLWLGNNAAVGGNLEVVGTSNLQGNVDADSDLNVDGVITNTTAATAVTVDDDLNVTGSADIDTDLNVDGNTVHVGTLDQQGIVSSSTGDLLFEDNLIPNTDATHDLGSATNQWVDLHLSNDAIIGNDANIANNAEIDGDLLLNDDDQTNHVGFTSPAVVASNIVWTLPAADGTADQQLITDGSGNLSWGSTSLQVAYEGGNEIITDAGDGDVIIRGTEELDVRVNIANDVAGNGAGITVDDDFTVINGDISFGTGSQFTIVGSNGNTTTNGTLTTQGLVTANLGMNIFGANLTVGGSNFIVTTGGDVTIEGLVSANDGLNVTGSNFTVGGAANFQVVESNGNTSVGGLFDVNDDTSAGADANVLVLGANLDVSSLSVSHAAGSIVYVGFTTPSNVTGAANGNATGVNGATLVKATGGSWYIVGTF